MNSTDPTKKKGMGGLTFNVWGLGLGVQGPGIRGWESESRLDVACALRENRLGKH